MKINPSLKKELKKYLIQKIKDESEKVEIYTANRLEKRDIEEIELRFPNIKQKKLDIIIDEDLIGGFILKEGSKVTDFSLKARLNQIKKNINEITW